MCSMAKKRKNEKKSFRRSADTYDILLFAFVEPQLPEHLVALFHHQGSLVGVRRDIAIHLWESEKKNGKRKRDARLEYESNFSARCLLDQWGSGDWLSWGILFLPQLPLSFTWISRYKSYLKIHARSFFPRHRHWLGLGKLFLCGMFENQVGGGLQNCRSFKAVLWARGGEGSGRRLMRIARATT